MDQLQRDQLQFNYNYGET